MEAFSKHNHGVVGHTTEAVSYGVLARNTARLAAPDRRRAARRRGQEPRRRRHQQHGSVRCRRTQRQRCRRLRTGALRRPRNRRHRRRDWGVVSDGDARVTGDLYVDGSIIGGSLASESGTVSLDADGTATVAPQQVTGVGPDSTISSPRSARRCPACTWSTVVTTAPDRGGPARRPGVVATAAPQRSHVDDRGFPAEASSRSRRSSGAAARPELPPTDRAPLIWAGSVPTAGTNPAQLAEWHDSRPDGCLRSRSGRRRRRRRGSCRRRRPCPRAAASPRVADLALDDPLQRAGAERRVEALAGPGAPSPRA